VEAEVCMRCGGEVEVENDAFCLLTPSLSSLRPPLPPTMSAALGYALLVAGPGVALYITLLGGRAFLLLVTLAR